ncbi:hypothetical protein IWW57_006432, partial [Coemansia sp. S610]
YGFVEFDEIRDAEVALKECNGMDVRGERMVVEFAKGPARRRDDNSCFRCGQEGHWSRDCPDSRRGGRSRSPRRYVPAPVVPTMPPVLSLPPTRCLPSSLCLFAEVPKITMTHANFGGGRNRQRSRSRDRGDRRDQRGGDRHRPSHHGSGGYSRSRSRGRDSRPHDSHRSGGGYSRRNHSRSASRSPGPRGHRSSGDGGRRPPPGARSRSPPARGQRGDRYPGPKDFDRRSADSAVGEDTFRR